MSDVTDEEHSRNADETIENSISDSGEGNRSNFPRPKPIPIPKPTRRERPIPIPKPKPIPKIQTGSTIRQSHIRLNTAKWTKDTKIQTALHATNTKFQLPSAGSRFTPLYSDNYSIVIKKMPPGLAPDRLLNKMLTDLNGTIKNKNFDDANIFLRRGSGPVRLGDIHDINVKGPINGSVILVDKSPTHFVFQTLKDPSYVFRHCESGSREFGYTQNSDGTATFYTRGIYKPTLKIYQTGSGLQQKAWTGLIRGIHDIVNKNGGHADWSTFTFTKEPYQ
jgi:hypothetical protein